MTDRKPGRRGSGWFSWYVDGIETTPRGFMDALTSLMEG